MNRFLKSPVLTFALVAADAVAFCACWFGTYALRDALADAQWFVRPINPVHNYVEALAVYLPFWILVCWYYGLYDHHEKVTGLNEVSRLLSTFAVGTVGSLAIAYLFKGWDIGRFVLLVSSSAFLLWLYAFRSALRRWKERMVDRGHGVKRVIVIGVGRTARRVMERIAQDPEGHLRLVGFVETNPRRASREIQGYPVLGSVTDLTGVLTEHPADEVVFAVPAMPQNAVLNLITRCEDMDIPFKIVSNLFEVLSPQMKVDVIDDFPVVRLHNKPMSLPQAAMKRALDLAVGAVLLALSAIPMLIVALAIRLESSGPALFRQQRVGKDGRLFTMYKFRTMVTSADPYAVAPGDAMDPRITRLGRLLRRYSFDEFPQLMNVLLGQMSMVGPRPEMPFIVEQYEPWQRRRLDVKPGLTGLWQVIGRKNLPLARNLEYDFYYIQNQSLFLDILILIRTVPAVILGRGAF